MELRCIDGVTVSGAGVDPAKGNGVDGARPAAFGGAAPRTPWGVDAPRGPYRTPLVMLVICGVAVALGIGGSSAAAGPGVAGSGVVASAPADPCVPGWVTGWQASVQPAPADPAFTGSTLRMLVHPQATGSEVRVRLSNAYGASPLVVGTVSAARSDGVAGLVPGTMAPVAFGGRQEVVIPAGGQVVSDPVPLVAEVGTPLAVSMFLPVVPGVVAQHAVALQTSYLSRHGDLALATSGAAFTAAVRSWVVLTGVDVLAPRPVRALVAMGDSITDGVGSALDADQRWSDALAERLTRAGGSAGMSVLNAGISRNRLLDDDPAADGDSPLTRFDRDVTDTAGAADVVLHIGTNDIAAGRSAAQIIEGMQAFARRTHAAGKRVFLTTITPSATGAHGTRVAAATRGAVNAWVLGHGREHADGVFDFATAVADPARPSRLARAFDAGDGLHLSAAGYRALAGAVDITTLSGSPCLADSSPVRVLVSGD